ncbi:MAG: toprim domain-containing protein [Dysosmobacter sp.]
MLYGLNLAKKSKRSNIILCEGNIDVVTLHQAGFDNAVASMGTALTVEQTRLLSRFTKELVLCYDNDNAGKIATERALEILNDSEFSVSRCLQLPTRVWWTANTGQAGRRRLHQASGTGRLRAAAQRQRERHGVPHGADCRQV